MFTYTGLINNGENYTQRFSKETDAFNVNSCLAKLIDKTFSKCKTFNVNKGQSHHLSIKQ